MTTPNHASLSYQDGFSAAGGVAFGVSPHYSCYDLFSPCFDMVVTPTTDPLYFFPPSSYFLTFLNTYEDLTGLYLAENFSTVLNNTLVVVIAMNINNIKALPNPLSQKNVVFSSISISLHFLSWKGEWVWKILIYFLFFLCFWDFCCVNVCDKWNWWNSSSSKQWRWCLLG